MSSNKIFWQSKTLAELKFDIDKFEALPLSSMEESLSRLYLEDHP